MIPQDPIHDKISHMPPKTGFAEDFDFEKLCMKRQGIISDLFFNQDNDNWMLWLGPRDPKIIIDFILERLR